MLTVHHLGKSQSERIVWLCEELAIPYALEVYDRDLVTRLAPARYKALHPIGAAPVITEGDIVLAESEAIIDYVVARHGGGHLTVPAEDAAFPDFVYWYHFTNGTLQPGLGRNMLLAWAGLGEDNAMVSAMRERTLGALSLVESRLDAVPYLAGNDLTVADIMIVFSLEQGAENLNQVVLPREGGGLRRSRTDA